MTDKQFHYIFMAPLFCTCQWRTTTLVDSIQISAVIY